MSGQIFLKDTTRLRKDSKLSHLHCYANVYFVMQSHTSDKTAVQQISPVCSSEQPANRTQRLKAVVALLLSEDSGMVKHQPHI